jgi:hypothetical protein
VEFSQSFGNNSFAPLFPKVDLEKFILAQPFLKVDWKRLD